MPGSNQVFKETDDEDAADKARNLGQTYEITSYVSGGVGVCLLVPGIYFLAKNPKSGQSSVSSHMAGVSILPNHVGATYLFRF